MITIILSWGPHGPQQFLCNVNGTFWPIRTTVSSVLGELGTKFQRLTLGFRGQTLHFNGAFMNSAICNRLWEIQDEGLQTINTNIFRERFLNFPLPVSPYCIHNSAIVLLDPET